MFGNLAHLIPPPPAQATGPPKDVAPPTPVHLPECRPRPAKPDRLRSDPEASEWMPAEHLVTLLQSLTRPADQVEIAHLEALGVQVFDGCPLHKLIPDPDRVPNFDEWDKLSREDAHVEDADNRVVLCNGNLAPGANKYVDLRQGLLTENERAFRAVRRVAPKPGEQYVRLGYCHEFFRHLETLTGFWEDTSVTRPATSTDEESSVGGGGPNDNATQKEYTAYYRTSAGSSMPAQYRTQLLTSFLKLVTYDFSCNIMGRQEPRLYIKSPAPTGSQDNSNPPHKHSYFSSGCSFVYRMPVARDSAKLGIIEGPIAAVSPRHMTNFPPVGRERESVIDLSREIIAALITAQHRAREGKQEVRVGKDAWWATRRRWGGGSGGPIGREGDLLEAQDGTPALVGDGDEPPAAWATLVEGDPTKNIPPPQTPSPSTMSSRRCFKASSERVTSGSPTSRLGGSSPTQPPSAKRARKSLAIYDAYRMVRPPSMHWDPKTRYAAIGRTKGADYDDVFVFSCLFHHVSVLRVRVPDQLLAILGGAVPDPAAAVWGGLDVWRTRWYDFFVPGDRVEAMKAVWAVTAYAMRRSPESAEEDVEGREQTTTTTTTTTKRKARKSTAADGDGEGKKGSPRR